MHPSSYTITIHVSHDEIQDALAKAGSSASPEDVVRALEERDPLNIPHALDAVIAHLNVHPDEHGPARVFQIIDQPQGSSVHWVDGSDDMGPFANADEAAIAATDAGGQHDEDRERYEPVPVTDKWHVASAEDEDEDEPAPV